ncbi:hypothetical protein [Undibacterium oligocarboniphilum]|uniref:Uncharacterized protein n=1 Tax=Undibacterium oligocarboniphilum TaxID=666702 RepID=A0A850QRJ0_9BURK|nr:hypothetical protein [Undibacterium oligocarboniphilum]MBC3871430.1 hypothetical protein [Undibacterium oligocarboniphilum]NVO78994.1 hypothetical protein [Undibacterium oligocarboniphilum]
MTAFISLFVIELILFWYAISIYWKYRFRIFKNKDVESSFLMRTGMTIGAAVLINFLGFAVIMFASVFLIEVIRSQTILELDQKENEKQKLKKQAIEASEPLSPT